MPNASYVITVNGLENLVAGLKSKANRLQSGANRTLDQAGAEIRDKVKAKAPRGATGDLQRSFQYKTTGELERTIGPYGVGRSKDFPPGHYGYFTEMGGGPRSGLVNITDLKTRLNINTGQAIAFARYLKKTGKAVQPKRLYIKEVAQESAQLFRTKVEVLVKESIR